MKKLLLGAAVVAMSASSAMATTTWQGDLYVSSITETTAGVCGANRINIYDFYRAVYKPKSVSGNGTQDHVALFGGRSAALILPNSNTFNGETLAAVYYINGRANFQNFSNVGIAPAVVTPASPTTADTTIKLSFVIPNFLNTTGCTVTMSGSVDLRPD